MLGSCIEFLRGSFQNTLLFNRGVKRGKRSGAWAPVGPVILLHDTTIELLQDLFTKNNSYSFNYINGINACKFITEKIDFHVSLIHECNYFARTCEESLKRFSTIVCRVQSQRFYFREGCLGKGARAGFGRSYYSSRAMLLS